MIEVKSRDVSKSMYDYAEDYFKIEEFIEKTEKRKLTPEERLIILAILANEE